MPEIRFGMRGLYTLQDGEDWRLMPGIGIAIVHPDRPPKIVHDDGSVTELNPTKDPS